MGFSFYHRKIILLHVLLYPYFEISSRKTTFLTETHISETELLPLTSGAAVCIIRLDRDFIYRKQENNT